MLPPCTLARARGTRHCRAAHCILIAAAPRIGRTAPPVPFGSAAGNLVRSGVERASRGRFPLSVCSVTLATLQGFAGSFREAGGSAEEGLTATGYGR